MGSGDQVYLKVRDCGKGLFSDERILEVEYYNGEKRDGSFDKGNIKEGKLRATLAKDYGSYVSIIPSQPFIGQAGGFILVNKKDVTSKLGSN